MERYEHLDAEAGWADSIDEAFASLSLDGVSERLSGNSKHTTPGKGPSERLPQETSKSPRELSIILMAMRKMREAIVASDRRDIFASRSYIFIVRATILMKHMESYHPALLHLLHKLHPSTPLTVSEQHEMVGYYVLDLACRQNDLAAAYQVRRRYEYKDIKIEAVLRALVHGNWHVYWKIERQVDIYQKQLIEWGNAGMKDRALKCLGQSYLSVEKSYVEEVAQRTWEEMGKKSNVSWQLEGEVVVIRRIKRR